MFLVPAFLVLKGLGVFEELAKRWHAVRRSIHSRVGGDASEMGRWPLQDHTDSSRKFAASEGHTSDAETMVWQNDEFGIGRMPQFSIHDQSKSSHPLDVGPVRALQGRVVSHDVLSPVDIEDSVIKQDDLKRSASNSSDLEQESVAAGITTASENTATVSTRGVIPVFPLSPRGSVARLAIESPSARLTSMVLAMVGEGAARHSTATGSSAMSAITTEQSEAQLIQHDVGGRVCEGWVWIKDSRRNPKFKWRYMVLDTCAGDGGPMLRYYRSEEDADSENVIGAIRMAGMKLEACTTMKGKLFKNFSFFAIMPGVMTESNAFRIECGCQMSAERQQWTDMLLKHGAGLLADSRKSQHLHLFKDPRAPKGSPFALSLGFFDEEDATSEAEVRVQVK